MIRILIRFMFLQVTGPVFLNVAGASDNQTSICQVTGRGSSCYVAYEQVKARIEANCNSFEPLCNGKWKDSFYEWYDLPMYRFDQVIREEKSEEACEVMVNYKKSCERIVKCLRPRCPFLF